LGATLRSSALMRAQGRKTKILLNGAGGCCGDFADLGFIWFDMTEGSEVFYFLISKA
jgi:hypothetical protein